MNCDLERLEGELDPTHQEANPVPEIGKVSGSAPRTWRTIYLVPTYHYIPMHPKGGDPKPHHLHCKKAYLSSHSGVSEKGGSVKSTTERPSPT